MTFPNQNSRKKSAFTGKTDIPEEAFFDFFTTNGDNFRISKANFLAGLGVSGTIEQVGEVGATQILNKNGAVNQIRSLLPGAGIKTSVSTLGSAQIDTDLLPASGGSQVLFNESTAPQFRAIVAGDGISATIGGGGDTIVIAQTTFTPPSSNVVIVNTLADLPDEAGGFRTLAPALMYLFNNDLVLDFPLKLQQTTVVVGSDNFVTILSYLGTGFMFECDDSTVKIRDIGLFCPNAEIVRHTSTIPERSIEMRNVFVVSALGGGEFDGSFFVILSNSIIQTMTTGFRFIGSSFGTINFNVFQAVVQSGLLFDFGTCVSNKIFINDCTIDLVTGTAEFIGGATLSANVTVDGLARVTNSNITGLGTIFPSGIQPGDERWEFAGSNIIVDTRPDAMLTLDAPEPVTIAAPSTPTPVGGAWTVQRESQFTTTTGGISKYLKLKPLITPITISLSVTASINNQTIAATLAINGVSVPSTMSVINLDNGETGGLGIVAQDELQQNDEVSIMLQTVGATNNITLESAHFRIN